MSERVTEEMVEQINDAVLAPKGYGLWKDMEPDQRADAVEVVNAIVTAALAARPASKCECDEDGVVRSACIMRGCQSCPASAEAVALDSRQVILAHLRGEVRPHSHGEDPCDCGPEDFGLSEEMADAMTAHRDRMLALYTTPPAAAQDRVTEALAGLTDLTLTQGHPEFGIECTVAIGEQYETVINQPDPITAIVNARAALNAARAAGATDGQ